MSLLTLYAVASANSAPKIIKQFNDFKDIHEALKSINVRFERWTTHDNSTADAADDTILAAYKDAIEHLQTQHQFQSMDIIRVTPAHPEKRQLRQKFLAEHTHNDFEIRFFIQGCGLFYLHVQDTVFAVLCEQNDLISVPAMTPHWFDMGAEPNFTTLRFFTTDEGWVADFTGDTLANAYPTLEQTRASIL
ncbi:MAG: cupin [Methylovulum sp.]|jgi:1,2-dihydroxy-3-keto-5-methylthiopentene dioxygenase|nr:cupin [Methylovulum sp.]